MNIILKSVKTDNMTHYQPAVIQPIDVTTQLAWFENQKQNNNLPSPPSTRLWWLRWASLKMPVATVLPASRLPGPAHLSEPPSLGSSLAQILPTAFSLFLNR